MAQNPQQEPPRRNPGRKAQGDYLRYSGIGLEFAAIIGVFALAGWWVDDRFHLAGSFPLFLLVGVFAGMALGILRMKRSLEVRRGERRPPRGGKGPPA